MFTKKNTFLKPHYPLAAAVAQNLKEIFTNGKYADRVIENSLKSNRKWGSRDRRFIAETTYDVVRHFRLLYESAGSKSPWMLIAAWFVINDLPLPEWKELKGISASPIKQKFQECSSQFRIAESIPDWLDDLGRTELGGNWEKEVRALNEEAAVVLRANSLKTTAAKLSKSLREAGIETELFPEIPEALILKERQNIFSSPQFKDGMFEMQDISSQRVARFMHLNEGMKVIDACAGAGGKTLHIASLMNGKGKIVAMDVEERKLNELKKRASRAGAQNIETHVINDEKLQKFAGVADRVLLDVPCSGLGVLKRNPDAKWKLTPESVASVKKIQQEILRKYSVMVKPGGKLIYATCSILPSENAGQVKTFLSENSGFAIEEEKLIMPSEGFDGFYMCRLKKE